MITDRIHSSNNSSHVIYVLIWTGLFGFCLGFSNATWQVSVETGQVLAGMVKYPVNIPFYMYHVRAFAIINHFSALLLHLIGSEKVVSIIISGLLGMVSFQALGMLIFAINRNIYMSVLGVIFIYFMNYLGQGVIYPIWLLGHEHTYGILGLSFIVLVISLFGAKAYKLGMFCLGLAPCVHLSLGAWLFFIMFLSALLRLDYAKKIVRAYYWYFIAGMLITISILIYQLYLMRDLPVIDPEVKRRYLESYIKYWDYHRRKFYWAFTAGTGQFKGWGVIFCIYGIVTGFLGLKLFRKDEALSFIFRVITVSGILSLLIGSITQLPPEKLPSYLLILMPGRYVNLNNMVLAASLLGILTFCDHKPFVTNYHVFTFLLVSSFFSKHEITVQIINFNIILLWLVYLALKTCYPIRNLYYFGRFGSGVLKYMHRLIEKGKFLSIRKHKVSYETLLLIFMIVFLLINLPRERFVNSYLVRRSDLKDSTNNKFYLEISQRKGAMLTTGYGDFFMISLKTKRPIMVDMSTTDILPFVPETAEIFNNILQRIYGIDLFKPPPENLRHLGIPPELYRDLWEKRTLKEWQDIKKEFGITDVLTRADWKLLLPVVVKNEKMILYEIPALHSLN